MISVQVPFMRYIGRWIVMFNREEGEWLAWLGGNYRATIRHFTTHAEAMAYADREARK